MFEDRWATTRELYGFFAFEHLPAHLQAISRPCHVLAEDMITALPDGRELVAGLRKLLEAKDCFVRQGLIAPKPEYTAT